VADVLTRHRRDWEELAATDPLWAILAAPQHRWGRWPLEEFFATGEEEIAGVLDVAGSLGYPKQHERALDFGCGVGRLTRALAGRFREVVGIDISEEMIRLARELGPPENCSFELNTSSDLTQFDSESFDFVYTALVLQHLPNRDLVRGYVGEFLRVLRPGGLAVFQALSHLPLLRRLQPRRRGYALLHHAGLPHEFLLSRLKLVPVRLSTISEDDVRSTVGARGGIVEHVQDHPEATDGVRSLRYYVRV
jgi:2-polyprenyl-3-methyl-5-hydroxy-6-metoxy-1,4-benzoquinol methylase